MVDAVGRNPPRNGEGDHAEHGGGADNALIDPSVSPDGLPPPRSGEDRKCVRHRTVGASNENIRLARRLRRTMSLPEVLLWNVLRTRPDGLKFRKQYPIGGYVADFACLKDPRVFDLWLVRAQRTPRVRNYRYWRCNSYRP